MRGNLSPSSLSMPSVKNRRIDDALRRVRVFTIHHARDGRKVHADVFGNVFQHHRLDVLHSVVQTLSDAARSTPRLCRSSVAGVRYCAADPLPNASSRE